MSYKAPGLSFSHEFGDIDRAEDHLLSSPEDAETTLGRVLVGWLCVAILVAAIQSYYAIRKAYHLIVLLVVFMGWFGPFSIAYFVPLDLSSTLYRECKWSDCETPYVYTSFQFQKTVWSVIYWTMFLLTWMAIPLLQSCLGNGGFTFMQRWRRALVWMSYYYIGVAILGLAGLAYLFSTKGFLTFWQIKALVMAISNAYGLFLVLLFMGHGLVYVPRSLWVRASKAETLRLVEHRAPRVRENMDYAIQELQDISREIAILDRKVKDTDPLRPYVDVLLEKSPVPDGPDPQRASQDHTAEDLGSLMDLHYKLIKALRDRQYCVFRWERLLKKAFRVQDVINNERRSRGPFISSLRPRRTGTFGPLLEYLEWYWWVFARGILLRITAVVLGLFSGVLLWSELTMNIQSPALSIIGLTINNDSIGYHVKEAFSYVTIIYMCFCTYSSLLKLRFFNLYRLVPHNLTEERSFLFYAAYLTRCTMPLCYNFLRLVTPDEKTSFQKYMGTINLVPALGEGFNGWLPIMLVFLVVMFLFNIHTKILSLLSINALFMEEDDSDIVDVEDGRILIERARTLAQRRQQDQLQNPRSTSIPTQNPRSREPSDPNPVHRVPTFESPGPDKGVPDGFRIGRQAWSFGVASRPSFGEVPGDEELWRNHTLDHRQELAGSPSVFTPRTRDDDRR